ncbi:MAG TPA: FG-GAP-like repeat-containing protein [bacterium]|jgi:hypothetical protein
MKRQIHALSAALIFLAVLPGWVYASWTQHGIDWSFPGACDVVARDLDGDGDRDAAGLSTNGTVNWYENDGNQVFTEHLVAQHITSSYYLEEGDLDGDGDWDLVVACSSPYTQPGGLYRLMNNGAMQFTVVQIPCDHKFYDLVVEDMDGDGDPDIVGTHTVPPWFDSLSWWENTENGQIYIEHNLLNFVGDGFGAADVDLDGDLDLVCSSYDSLLWLENNGNQTFTAHAVGTLAFSDDVNAGDLDGDGDMDIFAREYQTILWYHNDGSQNFSQVSEIPSALYMNEIQVMDVDGDGCMDVSGISGTWGYVRWIENFLCRFFDEHTISQPSVGTVNYDTCDFNGDGRVDFAVTGTMTSNNIQWYENTNVPTVKFQVAPVNQPIIIPPQGGEFSFDVWMWNTTADTLAADLWTAMMAEYPPIYREPIMLIEDHLLAPESSISRRLTQRVPAFVPPNEYYYQVKIGEFPRVEIDYADGFYFVKDSGDCIIARGLENGSDDEWEQMERPLNVNWLAGENVTIRPNPFNPTTVLSFELLNASLANLPVYDISGRRVATLVEGWREAGRLEVTFDGSNLPSGIYLYRLQAGEFTTSGKMVLLK